VQILNAVLAQDVEEFDDGTRNIFGMLGGLRVTAVPYVEPEMKLFIHFSANQGEVGIEKLIDMQLLAADGEMMKRTQGTLTVPEPPRPGTRSNFSVTLPLADVPFIQSGDYGFHIVVEGVERTIPFYISVEEGEEA
jgi:hypothetical protein